MRSTSFPDQAAGAVFACLRIIDAYFLDGLVDLIADSGVVRLSHAARAEWLVQFYALLMALGLAGFLLSVFVADSSLAFARLAPGARAASAGQVNS